MPYTPPPIALGRPKTGSTYGITIPGVEITGVGTVALTANQVRYEQFPVYTPITIDQLITEITGAGAGSTTFRISIYPLDINGQPLTLLRDFGTQPADGITVLTLTLNPVLSLSPGRYGFAINSDGSPTMRCLRAGSMFAGIGATFGSAPFNTSLTVSQAYGAFPNVGLPWTALNGGGGSPAQHCVTCRVSIP